MLDWWKTNWKAFMTMLFSFLMTVWMAFLTSKTNKAEVKQGEIEFNQELQWEAAKANQANAETALNALNIPATQADYNRVVETKK